jgi:hypothetical protein
MCKARDADPETYALFLQCIREGDDPADIEPKLYRLKTSDAKLAMVWAAVRRLAPEAVDNAIHGVRILDVLTGKTIPAKTIARLYYRAEHRRKSDPAFKKLSDETLAGKRQSAKEILQAIQSRFQEET